MEDLELYGEGKAVLGAGTDQLVLEVWHDGHYVIDNDSGESAETYGVRLITDTEDYECADIYDLQERTPNVAEARRQVAAMLWLANREDWPEWVTAWAARNRPELERLTTAA